ncbi:sterol desaturase family protein [Vibrio hippocampi]|uniref:Fatty acid hydroxylase domain-containing protein n=1 Tax=Vibrio hippocampi TaxID=654686 RepID=A0ABN8DKN0_9VIBR|nr:sterol desaturase family protein [Vibrio hippocampi]CAH0525895.1 hypothetical protein VHP8226_01388 [Vibrio hippocampi]
MFEIKAVLEHSDSVRLSIFVMVFIACLLWEWTLPRIKRNQTRLLRWSNNLALVAFNSVLLQLIMPLLAIDSAYLASENQWGLFNQVSISSWLLIPLCILMLDLLVYSQHWLFHRIPLLWRLHRVHHTDRDLDFTTGARFHPLEILLSMWIKIAAVILLGMPVIAVLLFEILLNASAMFNHSNARLAPTLDRRLRRFIVTPDFHRVHHSDRPRETHSNFGFFLSVWDRLFKTCIEQPRDGHHKMAIGLPLFTDDKQQRLDNLLTQPFRRETD